MVLFRLQNRIWKCVQNHVSTMTLTIFFVCVFYFSKSCFCYHQIAYDSYWVIISCIPIYYILHVHVYIQLNMCVLYGLWFMVTYIICWNFYVNYIAELFNLKASTFVTGGFFYRPASWMWFWCFGQEDLILLVPAVFLLLESFSAFFLILFVNIFS